MTEITASIAPRVQPPQPPQASWLKTVFVRLGVLPFLLVGFVWVKLLVRRRSARVKTS